MQKMLVVIVLLTLVITGSSASSFSDVTFTSIDGEDHRLSDFEGRPVIIELISTECQFCQEQHPIVTRVVEDYEELQLLTLSSSPSDSLEDMKEFVIHYPMNWTTGIIRDSNFLQKYNVKYFPTFLFFNSTGDYQGCVNGLQKEAALSELFFMSYHEMPELSQRYGGKCKDTLNVEILLMSVGLTTSFVIAVYMVTRGRKVKKN